MQASFPIHPGQLQMRMATGRRIKVQLINRLALELSNVRDRGERRLSHKLSAMNGIWYDSDLRRVANGNSLLNRAEPS
jgi:hypothetical protein